MAMKLSELTAWVERLNANPDPENPDPTIFFEVGGGTALQDLLYQGVHHVLLDCLDPLYMEEPSGPGHKYEPYTPRLSHLNVKDIPGANPTDHVLNLTVKTGLSFGEWYAVEENGEWVVRHGNWRGNQGTLVESGFPSKIAAGMAIASRNPEWNPLPQASWIKESEVPGVYSEHTMELGPRMAEMKANARKIERPKTPRRFAVPVRPMKYHPTFSQIAKLGLERELAVGKSLVKKRN